MLIACDGYYYAGKEIDLADKLAASAPLPSVEHVVIVPYLGRAEAPVARRRADGGCTRTAHHDLA